MKTHVNIGGVTLTRAQVEKALVELNKPEPPQFKTGDIVQTSGGSSSMVVFSRESPLGKIILATYPASYMNNLRVVSIGLEQGHIYSYLPSDLKKVS